MRRIHDFHGGVHPPENKRQSLGQPIRSAGIPPQLVLPLSQHAGAPARPVVSIGERVLKGQLLAAANGVVSASVHAPSSGTVIAIEERPVPHPSGLEAPCMVLETDGEDRWMTLSAPADYRDCDAAELLERIRAAGIAGLGGAGFPTAVKLTSGTHHRIDTLIINGAECEPYITADDMLMRERAADIVEGIAVLQHLLTPREVLIGVEDNKPEAIAALRAAIGERPVEVVVVPTRYPSGGEKQLIEILTGRQVPSGGLPADAGVVCQNVGTAVAVRDAVVHGRPLISRITTITGEAIQQPGNYEVLFGTPIRYLLEQAGWETDRTQRLVMGGPMMGFTVTRLEAPVVKTTNCLLVPTPEELPAPPPAQACIRCGLCAEACPASLLPQQLFWFARGKESEKLEQHHLFDCIECGACSWVCPSQIPLVQYYRAAKADILQQRRDHVKAEHSRLRFEARQERLAREEAEREAKRAARKRAAEERARAAEAEGGEDPIQAAIARAQAKKAAQQAAPAASPEEKAAAEREATRNKLAKMQERLDKARETGEEEKIVSALEASVKRLQDKLAAQQETSE